jgi:hypothetical protein
VKKVLAILLPFFPLSFILFIGLFLQIAEEEDALEENEDHNFIKVAIVEDKAYWVINNILYEANVVDGEIEKEEASPVDAFKMNYKEVNKLMSILDNMQDWKN